MLEEIKTAPVQALPKASCVNKTLFRYRLITETESEIVFRFISIFLTYVIFGKHYIPILSEMGYKLRGKRLWQKLW